MQRTLISTLAYLVASSSSRLWPRAARSCTVSDGSRPPAVIRKATIRHSPYYAQCTSGTGPATTATSVHATTTTTTRATSTTTTVPRTSSTRQCHFVTGLPQSPRQLLRRLVRRPPPLPPCPGHGRPRPQGAPVRRDPVPGPDLGIAARIFRDLLVIFLIVLSQVSGNPDQTNSADTAFTAAATRNAPVPVIQVDRPDRHHFGIQPIIDQASADSEIIVELVIYDLPGHDWQPWHPTSSYQLVLDRYKEEYVDVITKIHQPRSDRRRVGWPEPCDNLTDLQSAAAIGTLECNSGADSLYSVSCSSVPTVFESSCVSPLEISDGT
ncbi:hypothetical protein BJ742DRAFT_741941 [Cladochytrium replicatum]|nr:hypothetical protein BJ742DRAFT_741941 [Cladochytrium replicatum]